MNVRRIAVVLVLGLLLAACGGDDDTADTAAEESEPAAAATTPAETEVSEPASEPASEPVSEPASEPAAGEAPTVAVADTSLGEVLVDGEGMTLYVFDNDTDGTSTCYDDCASTWPPLTGEATAGEGADETLLGTTERDDGAMQVTYADRPLYYFAGDAAEGDVNGQGVGEVWWVVGPDGEAIEEASTASASRY